MKIGEQDTSKGKIVDSKGQPFNGPNPTTLKPTTSNACAPAQQDHASDSAQLITGNEIANGAAFICRILLIGTALAAAVIGARLFGNGGKVAIASGAVNVPANWAWILFLVLTLGHGVYGFWLVRNIGIFREQHKNDPDCCKLIERIRSEPNMFVFGLIPRLPLKQGKHLIPMSWKDPSTKFSYFALLTFLVSMLPWYVAANGALNWVTGSWFWVSLVAAVILALANWLLGTNWIFALSKLTEPSVSQQSRDSGGPGSHPAISSVASSHPAISSVASSQQSLIIPPSEWRLSGILSNLSFRSKIL